MLQQYLLPKLQHFFNILEQNGFSKEKIQTAYQKNKFSAVKISTADLKAYQQQAFIANAKGVTIQSLKDECKNRGLKMTGSKIQLQARLQGLPEPKKGKKCKLPQVTKGKIIDKIRSTVAKIGIVRHENGEDYWHPETGLIFDPQSGMAIASFRHGKKHNLNADDVQKCLLYNIPYGIPRNLDEGMNRIVDEKLANVLTQEDFHPHAEDEEEGDEDEEEGDEEEF